MKRNVGKVFRQQSRCAEIRDDETVAAGSPGLGRSLYEIRTFAVIDQGVKSHINPDSAAVSEGYAFRKLTGRKVHGAVSRVEGLRAEIYRVGAGGDGRAKRGGGAGRGEKFGKPFSVCV